MAPSGEPRPSSTIDALFAHLTILNKVMVPDKNQPELDATHPPVNPSTDADALERTQVFSGDSSGSAGSHGSAGSSGPASNPSSMSGNGNSGSRQTKQKSIGGYQLLRLLGEGGMGRVYQASDASGRMVAVKLLSPELSRSPDALERFKQEGLIASAINHPHCVFVHQADEENGTPFIAMELMTGQTLKDIVQRSGPLNANDAVRLILQCVDGLIEAHSQGMIHRDVKPANCYLDDKGNVKIGDFGLARSLVSDSELTRTGAFLGTPLYSSPEQILGETIDEQSDIYSLSATLYFLLAGKAPFESPNAPQVIAKIVSADPPPFSEAGVDVPHAIEQIVFRGLSRDRSKRYANLQQLKSALTEAVAQREAISKIPRRSLAFIADSFMLSILFSIGALSFIAFNKLEADFPIYINIVTTSFTWLYLFLSESLFGTTIGKRLLSLRVVNSTTNGKASFFNVLLRSMAFMGITNFIEIFTQLMLMMWHFSPKDYPVYYSLASWIGIFVGYGSILSIWWASGKKQLLHEWLSNTNTVVFNLRSAALSVELEQPKWALPLATIPDSAKIPNKIGRFEVQGRIETSDGSIWLAAHDIALSRDVWIHWYDATIPALSKSREKCARRLRMRFLETGTHDGSRWDAFVAPEGAPLPIWFGFRNPMPWPVTIQVLREVIQECNATEDKLSLEQIDISQLWFTDSSKLICCEAPIVLRSVGHTNGSHSDDRNVLTQIANLAIPTKGEQHNQAPRSSSSKFISVAPYRATQLLQQIKTLPKIQPQWIEQCLDQIENRPQSTTLSMRLAHATALAIAMATPWLVLVGILVVPASMQVVEEKQRSELLTSLGALVRGSDKYEKLFETLTEPERADLLAPERLLEIEQAADGSFDRFLGGYKRLGILERLVLDQQNILMGRNDFLERPVADMTLFDKQLAEPKPNSTPEKTDSGTNESEGSTSNNLDGKKEKIEQVVQRSTQNVPRIRIGPSGAGKRDIDIQWDDEAPSMQSMYKSLEGWREIQDPKPQSWVSWIRWRALQLVLIPTAILIVWTGAWRGGLLNWFFGMALVRRDGRRAGFAQSILRSTLFWTPFAVIAILILQLDSTGIGYLWWTQQLRRLFLIMPVIYLLILLRWPQRGPHDAMCSTYIVPR